MTELGLAKQSDFTRRGKITHAAAERLRRLSILAEQARPYIKPRSPNAPQYRVARPRDPKVLGALRAAGPSSLQSSRQPWALVWTGLGTDDKGNAVTAPLQSLRLTTEGYVVVSTPAGRRVVIDFTGAEWLKSPKKFENLARKVAKRLGLENVAVNLRVNEYSTTIGYRLEDLDDIVKEWQNKYTYPTQPNGQLHRDDMRRWFHGFELRELKSPTGESSGRKKTTRRRKSSRTKTGSRKTDRSKARRARH